MTRVASDIRLFSVHARHMGGHHARVVEGASFEAAAVAYVEDFHPALTNDPEFSVIVREMATGHEHCFRIDLNTGNTQTCG